MEEENDAYVHVTNVAADAAAPTLTELRSMNSKLEKAWLDQGAEDPLQAALNKVPTSERWGYWLACYFLRFRF
jgi:hypothetical protein